MRPLKLIKSLFIIILFITLSACGTFRPAIPIRDIPDSAPEIVRNKIEELYSYRAYRRVNAAHRLGEMGSYAVDSIPFLIDLLEDHTSVNSDDREGGPDIVSNAAAFALAKIGDARAVEPLLDTLKDKDMPDRAAKADALISMGSKALDPLIKILRNDDFLSRMLAAKTLGSIGKKRSVEPLIVALDDDYFTVRLNAATALGNIKDTRAVEPLIMRLNDYYERIRWEAAASLGKISDARAVEPLLRMIDFKGFLVQNSYINALKDIGDVAVIPVIDILKGNLITTEPEAFDWRRRENAAKLLGKLGNPLAVKPLLATLGTKNNILLTNAIITLGEIKDKRATMPLIAMLKDERIIVRRASASALGSVADDRAIGALIALLDDKDGKVRENVTRALVTITGEDFRQNKAKWEAWQTERLTK